MDRKQYNDAVREWSPRIYRYVLKSTRREAESQDIVQETFMKLWEHRHKVDPAKVKSWLFTVAHNAMLNFLKKDKRTDSLENHPHREPSYEENRYELQELIDLALATLPAVQRSLILLRDLEGYSYQDIAEMLDLSETQVKVYLFRARSRIKEKIMHLYVKQ